MADLETTTFRDFEHDRDVEAAFRAWHEAGWVQPGDEEGFRVYISGCAARVAELNGEVECLVCAFPANVRYQDDDLPLSAVAGVVTARVARRRGLAARALAQLLVSEVERGALVAGLSMFEQGFYDRLGFGTGSYERHISFDPAVLQVGGVARVPRRLTWDDWPHIRASLLARHRTHGGVNILAEEAVHAEALWAKKGFGLGYFDGPNGELTHHVWIRNDGSEFGPYGVTWLTWQTPEQFLELMALIKSWGDQVRQVRMHEPPGVMMQDLFRQPFANARVRAKGDYPMTTRSEAYWQIRILDLPACLARTHLPGGTVRFNLQLTDPIGQFLPDDAAWRGVAGDYVACLGPDSWARPGTDPSLPTLRATVGAFSRLWFGALPATSLAITDKLTAPPALLQALDRTVRLPVPHLGWEF